MTLLKTLEVIIEESQIVLTYQGKTCTIFNPNYFDHIELLSPASLSLGNYIYIGPMSNLFTRSLLMLFKS